MKCRGISSLLLFMLSSCSIHPLMQDQEFALIALGADIQSLENYYGTPYEIRDLKNGVIEYSYIQRIPCGKTGMEQVEFLFKVHEGKIIEKLRCETRN